MSRTIAHGAPIVGGVTRDGSGEGLRGIPVIARNVQDLEEFLKHKAADRGRLHVNSQIRRLIPDLPRTESEIRKPARI